MSKSRLGAFARIIFVSVSILLLGSGCASNALKSTPFFEHGAQQDADRVNLWPLLYYRDSTLSYLWPIGEVSDTSFAIRPLFSRYESDYGGNIYNVLWPLGRFDTNKNEHRFFPFFWGKDYFFTFPLFYYFGPLSEKNSGTALLPLWFYMNGRENDYDLWMLAGLARSYKWQNYEGWHAWPLAGNKYKNDQSYKKSFWLWPLGARRVRGENVRHRFLPFYSAGPDFFYSLPYSYDKRGKQHSQSIPLLLSWQSLDSATESRSLYAAAGLYHSRRGVEGQDRDWLLPLYYRDQKEGLTLTPLWARQRQADGTGWSAIPPLLSWQSLDSATESRSLYAAAGLYHHRRGAEGKDRDWLLPLYYRDQKKGLTLSPLWAGRRRSDNSGWSAIPPLLSWQSQDTATDSRSLYAAAGLFHRRRGVEGKDRDWLLPLYYHDQEDGLTLTPLWAKQKRPDGTSWSAIPPLLSWQSRDSATQAKSTYVAGGLFHRRRGAEGRNRDWLLPFYYHDQAGGLTMTPLWSKQRQADGTSWSAIPPLLSWQSRDSASGATSTFAAAGLYHRRRGAEGRDRDWLLPIYYQNQENGLTLSPIWAKRKRSDNSGWSAIPPLLSWQSRDAATGVSSTFAAAGLYHRRRGAAGKDRDWLLPFYYHDQKRDLTVTPVWMRRRSSPEEHWTAIPPLLSWRTREKNLETLTLAAGLYRRKKDLSGKDGSSWLLPFYYRADKRNTFLTPLFGGWDHSEEAARSRYYLTPLFGTTSGDVNGFWVFPLLSHVDDGELVESRFLWGTRRRDISGADKITFPPFYRYDVRGNPDDVLAMMDSQTDPGIENIRVHRSSRWLLFMKRNSEKARVRSDRSTSQPVRTLDYERFRNLAILSFNTHERTAKFKIGGSKTSDEQSQESILLLGLYYSYKSSETSIDNYSSRQSHSVEIERGLLFNTCSYKREKDTRSDGSIQTDYTRFHIFWWLVNYERKGEDASLDAFPAITWDKRADGSRKSSFLWRLYRNEVTADGQRNLDILFLPIRRAKK